MDYKDLLRKYIDHVGDCEGAEFLGRGYQYGFSDDEIVALRRLSGWNDAGTDWSLERYEERFGVDDEEM